MNLDKLLLNFVIVNIQKFIKKFYDKVSNQLWITNLKYILIIKIIKMQELAKILV